MVPALPAAAKVVPPAPPDATPKSESFRIGECKAQPTPSEDVMIVPEPPTAAKMAAAKGHA